MKIRRLATGGTSVRCPGCGASRVFASPSAPPGSICHEPFFHESDTCPVLLRIQGSANLGLGDSATRQ